MMTLCSATGCEEYERLYAGDLEPYSWAFHLFSHSYFAGEFSMPYCDCSISARFK